MADTCQYCRWFYILPKGGMTFTETMWCRRYPEWVAKDYRTPACGEFELEPKVEERL